MNSRALLLQLLFALSFCSTPAFSQNVSENPLLNRAVLKYIGGATLTQLQAEDPVKYAKINYYFAHSFNVELTNCVGCLVDYNQLLNLDLFNIVEYEGLRETTEEHTFFFKENEYKITLLSKEEMSLNLGGLSSEDILNIYYVRPIPGWFDTGNDVIDYQNYTAELQIWAREFPEEYSALTSSSTLLKVHIADFLMLSTDRRNSLFNHQGGYILID